MLKLTTSVVSLAVLASAALAQPKAGAPAADKAAPPPATNTPAKAMEPPKMPDPPAEIAEMAKGMNGTWKCTGKADMGGTTIDVKATITHKLDATLNKFWIQSTFAGGGLKGPAVMKFTMYTTYDPTTKKWWRTSVNGRGGHSTAVGTQTDKKVSWEGDAVGPMGAIKQRGTEEMVSAKEVHVMGEISKDGGKTWIFDHDATCKK